MQGDNISAIPNKLYSTIYNLHKYQYNLINGGQAMVKNKFQPLAVSGSPPRSNNQYFTFNYTPQPLPEPVYIVPDFGLPFYYYVIKNAVTLEQLISPESQLRLYKFDPKQHQMMTKQFNATDSRFSLIHFPAEYLNVQGRNDAPVHYGAFSLDQFTKHGKGKLTGDLHVHYYEKGPNNVSFTNFSVVLSGLMDKTFTLNLNDFHRRK